jgi:hypothetical protein
VCQGGQCQAATCSDSVQNGAESDTDCGSACSLGCLDGQACLEPADCISGVCDETCQVPSCDDTVANGSETDVDCGGGCPDVCSTGDGCRLHTDCLTGACVDALCTATLQVFYRNETSSQSSFVRPYLQIRNTGPTAIAASELELRYFYTNDGVQGEVVDCYFAQFGCEDLMMSIVEVEAPLPLADHYLSVKFGPNAGSVPINGGYGLEPALHDPSFTEYDQAGDYSYDPSKKAYAAHDKICLYRKGTLIWGTEPRL